MNGLQPRAKRRWLCLLSPESRRVLLILRRTPSRSGEGSKPKVLRDYPAAHSMDTWWYAVDADGRIAVGSTGESGCVLADGASIEISELLARLRGRPVTDEDPDNWDEMEREIIRQGVYLYDLYLDYSPFLSPYAMRFAPEQPIHVDQLAPDLRGIFKTVELENARFGEARLLQLAEHAECIGYSDEPAYLASDGKTIRPVPGREDSFAAFVAELRRDFPQMYDAYVIDGIEKPEHKN